MVFRCAVAGLAGRMALRAVVVLRLVRVRWTRGVTLVLVHHQVMFAAGAFVRSVLAAGTISFARHASAVLGIFAEKTKITKLARCHTMQILKKNNQMYVLS